MNYGKFFRLNNNKSDISKGITVFDYLWLHDTSTEKSLSGHPVYLTITKDSLDFHAHYYDESKDKHLHNTILSLPLSANVEIKDGLTGALVEGYKTNFPKYDNSRSNYLFKILLKTIPQQDENQIDYSHLTIFGENNKNIFQLFSEKLKPHFANNQYNCDALRIIINSEKFRFNYFIRKLILDFIFDLEHTKVFQTSPHYEHISVKLKENYFFSALAAKANFYYWREIIAGELLDKKQKLKEKKDEYYFDWNINTDEKYHKLKNEILQLKREINELENKEILSIEKDYYLKSQIQWEKTIRSSKAEENFNGYEDEWFDDPEIEMQGVYDKNIRNIKITNKTLEETTKRSKQISSRWRVAHYDIFKSKYIVMPRVFISIVAAWLTFILGSNLWGSLANNSFTRINPDNGSVVWFCTTLCIVSGLWLLYLRTKTKINLNFKQKKWKVWRLICRGSAYMTVLSFIYSAIIGAILRIFVFDQKHGYEIHYSCSYWFGANSHFYWVAVFLAIFIGVVIQSFMDRKTPADEL